MNLNPLATAALVMIGIAQVWQASTAIQPTPQETDSDVAERVTCLIFGSNPYASCATLK